ncbi:hypothetical protein D3C87_1857680 [compost metagenome]
MAGPHDQRRPDEPAGGGGNDGVAPAVRVEHIETTFLEDLLDGRDAFHVIHGPPHIEGMHGKAGIAKTFGQLRLRLADRFKMMPARAHRVHLLEYPSFLPAEAGGCFRVNDTQARH